MSDSTRTSSSPLPLAPVFGWILLALGLVAVLVFGLMQAGVLGGASSETHGEPALRIRTKSAALRQAESLLVGDGRRLGGLTSDPNALAQAGDLLAAERAARGPSPELMRLEGLRLWAQDQQPAALRALEHSVELDPMWVEGWMTLGAFQVEVRRLEAAEHAFRKVIELRPEAPAAWNNLGQTLWLMGRRDEAEQAYRNQITLEKMLAARAEAAVTEQPPSEQPVEDGADDSSGSGSGSGPENDGTH